MEFSLEDLLQPVGILWLSALLATLVLLWRRQFRWSLMAFTLSAGIWAVTGTPLPARLLADLERPYVGSPRVAPVSDAVVMLGGTHDFSTRSLLPINLGDAVDRAVTAVELVRLGKARALVLGGGYYEYQGVRRPDGELLERWLREWRVPPGPVVLLGACTNTRDEAERTARVAREQGWRRILLVTTASHLRRAEATFRRAGVDVVPVGCDFLGLDALDEPSKLWRLTPDARHEVYFRLWLHEVIGWWWYRLKGWT